uniref:Uncharacterized protein n=1 Tax=Macaca nemestrina TaxID=9545 RepID=A0A2K6DGQ5_MACNE
MSWISFSFHTGRHLIGKISLSRCHPFRLEPDFSPIYIFFFSPQRVPSLMSPSGIKCTLKKGAGWIFKRRGALRLDPEGSSPSHSQPVCSTPHTEEDYCFSFTWSFPSTWC